MHHINCICIPLLLLSCVWRVVKKKTLSVYCVSRSCLWMRIVLCPGGDKIVLRHIHIIAYWFSFCQQSYKFPLSWTLSGSGHWGLQPCKVPLYGKVYGTQRLTCTSALHVFYAQLCILSYIFFSIGISMNADTLQLQVFKFYIKVETIVCSSSCCCRFLSKQPCPTDRFNFRSQKGRVTLSSTLISALGFSAANFRSGMWFTSCRKPVCFGLTVIQRH